VCGCSLGDGAISNRRSDRDPRDRREEPQRGERLGLPEITGAALSLPLAEKLELFETLRADLAESTTSILSDEDGTNRRLRLQREALDAMGKTAAHLDLSDGTAPTPAQFDGAARELGLPWTAARVIRVWERWRVAVDGYLGRVTPETPTRRAQRRRKRGGAGGYMDSFEGMRLWLADESTTVEDLPSYDTFADGYNAKLSASEQRLRRGHTIRRKHSVSWEHLVAIAKGEMTLEEARQAELAQQLPRGRDAIVGLAVIARLLGVSSATAKDRADRDEHFPTAVAQIMGDRAWLLSDVQRYRKRLAPLARQENEMQGRFMDARELRARLGMNERTMWRVILDQRWDRAPQPAGAVGKGVWYWKREQAERWLRGREQH